MPRIPTPSVGIVPNPRALSACTVGIPGTNDPTETFGRIREKEKWSDRKIIAPFSRVVVLPDEFKEFIERWQAACMRRLSVGKTDPVSCRGNPKDSDDRGRFRRSGFRSGREFAAWLGLVPRHDGIVPSSQFVDLLRISSAATGQEGDGIEL